MRKSHKSLRTDLLKFDRLSLLGFGRTWAILLCTEINTMDAEEPRTHLCWGKEEWVTAYLRAPLLIAFGLILPIIVLYLLGHKNG